MHLYSRSVGLGSVSTRPAMDRLINSIIKQAEEDHTVIYSKKRNLGGGYFEAQINKTMFEGEAAGLSVRGMYSPTKNKFKKLFYFPYVESDYVHNCPEITVGRLADREAYMVHCNETAREILPIFFLNNIVEYMEEDAGFTTKNRFVLISALSLEGKIIFPVNKTEQQIEQSKIVGHKRSMLIDKAMKGDQEAIDSLTIGDYDMLSRIYKRVRREDVYSIVDSSFVPSGLECDIYSVVGNICWVKKLKNRVTDEDVFFMLLECNDTYFTLAVNSADLVGVPVKGFRFVGRIWLQGNILPA